MNRIRRFNQIAFALLATVAISGFAQPVYPDRPIRIVVGYPPGQAVDITARTFAAAMAKELGQNIVVDNKPGANGILGAQDVRVARPDGYTLLAGTSGQLTINTSLYKKLPYDSLKDFQPVGLFGRAPAVLLAHPSFPANTLAELIALAKSKPGKLDYGSGGSGITAHLTMELFLEASGIQINHVPYKGSPAALNDLIGGQIPLMMENVVSALPHIKSGKLKALGVTSLRRYAALPEVPTIAEQGIKDFEATAWSALVAPVGTPPEVIARLNAAMRKAAATPQVAQTLQAAGILDTETLSPAEFRGLMERETRNWGRAVQKSGAQVD
jgi:tripartite-type tricarboxylate transporter receptor subunit TctC